MKAAPSVFREALYALPGFLRGGTEVAVGTLLCRASIISILLLPFRRLVGAWVNLQASRGKALEATGSSVVQNL